VRAAYIVALILAGFSFVPLIFGPSVSLFTAVICLLAGLGIGRGRAWSAYGLALLVLAQLVIAAISLLQGVAGDLVATVVDVTLVVLFYLAGRSLSQTGLPKGRRGRWVALAALTGVPFLFVQVFMIPAPNTGHHSRGRRCRR